MAFSVSASLVFRATGPGPSARCSQREPETCCPLELCRYAPQALRSR